MPSNRNYPPNPLPCGCGVKGLLLLPSQEHDLHVEFCPLHAAAEDLLIALGTMIAERDRIWEVWNEELLAAEQQHHAGYIPISRHDSQEAAERAIRHLDSWNGGAKYVAVEAKRADEENPS